MATEMRHAVSGIERCFQAQQKLDERFEAYVEDQDTLRRATFRWVIGSVLAATGLILTAVGLLIGRF
jgi:hypothetical protein